MRSESKNPEDIFHEASEITNPKKRNAYLDEACQGNEKLRAEVDDLLSSDEQAGSFLAVPPVDSEVTLDMSSKGLPGTKIGRYELVQLIGEGGMGLVYLAQQKQPVKRQIALKIIKPGMDSKEVIGRFEAERQALAVLDHPNIARVFDAGTTDTGRPYFVMEYVKGLPITRYCDERKLDIEQRLRLFKDICEAVHHAHQKGIIHRDLKPSNILVSVHGDRAVPKIIDFGIAKAMASSLTDKTVVTYQGQLLGTPEYMSPEQVDMAVQDIDTRSDIYSLGVVLYELLAGALPFERASLQKLSFAELQRTIREQEPATPSHRLSSLGEQAKTIAASRMTHVVPLARRLHRELEWIPLKAMRKDRCRRYKSASEMADDVQNYLNGNPLIAGPETAMYRVQKFVKKHAGSVTTVALTAAAIILGLVISIVMYIEAEEARADTEQQRKRAQLAEAEALDTAEKYRLEAYASKIAQAEISSRHEDVWGSREILKSCPEDLRGWEWDYLWNSSDDAVMTFRGHEAGVSGFAIHPDGNRIASASFDHSIKVWDLSTGQEISTLRGHAAPVTCVAYSRNGERIVSGDQDNLVKIWDAENARELMTLEGHRASLVLVAFSSDYKEIVSVDWKESIKTWNSITGSQLTSAHIGSITAATISADGHLLGLAEGDELKILRTDTLDQVTKIQFENRWAYGVGISRDNKYVAASLYDEDGIEDGIKLYTLDNGQETMTIHTDLSLSNTLAMTPDSKRLLVGGLGGKIKMYDVSTGQELRSFSGHGNYLGQIAIHPHSGQLISCGWDKTVMVWDITSESRPLTFYSSGSTIWDTVFNPRGNLLASYDKDGVLRMWDVQSGSEIDVPTRIRTNVNSLAFSPDGRHLICGSRKVVWRWEMSAADKATLLYKCKSSLRSLTYSPNGKYVLICTDQANSELILLDALSGALVRSFCFNGYRARLRYETFSPDSQHIYARAGNGVVRVWHVETGEELESIHAGIEYAVWTTFSPDGSRVLFLEEGMLRIFDVRSRRLCVTISSDRGELNSPIFSPDGQRVAATGPLDRSINMWDVETGAKMMTKYMPGEAVHSLAFSPDGKTLVVGQGHKVILLESSPISYESRHLTFHGRQVVAELYEKEGFYYKVAERLETDDQMKSGLRTIALQIAKARLGDDICKLRNGIRATIDINDANVADCGHAMEMARTLCRLHPSDSESYCLLGVALYRTEAFEESLSSLLRANEMLADDVVTNDRLFARIQAFSAMNLNRLGKPKEATSKLEGFRKTVLDKELHDLDELLIDVEKLFAGNDERVVSLWQSIRSQDVEDATKRMGELRSLGNQSLQEELQIAGYLLSRTYYDRAKGRKYDYISAIEDYEMAIQLYPQDAASLTNLAWLRVACVDSELRDPNKAAQAARAAARIEGEYSEESLQALAAAYSELGDYESAIASQIAANKKLPASLPKSYLMLQDAVKEHYESGKAYHIGDLWSFSHGALVAHWTFDACDNDGIVADSSGNQLDGRLVEDARIVADPERGNVLQLDGNGAYVNCGNHLAFDIGGAISLSVWIKTKGSADKDQLILSKSVRPWVLYREARNAGVGFACTGLRGATEWERTVRADIDLSNEKWNHVVGVFDGKKLYLYVDGMLSSSKPIWTLKGMATSENPVCIGSVGALPEQCYCGLIDDVRIYSYALSADEVKGLYEGREPPRKKSPNMAKEDKS